MNEKMDKLIREIAEKSYESDGHVRIPVSFLRQVVEAAYLDGQLDANRTHLSALQNVRLAVEEEIDNHLDSIK